MDITAASKWNEVTLRVGRTVLGPTLARADLRTGRSYQLPDGSTLFIKVDQAFIWPVLRIERDGIVVPGSDASLEHTTNFAGKWLAGLGVLNLIFGMLQGTPDARNGGIIVGVFLVAMGYFTRKGSRVSLVLGTGLYALGAVLTLVSRPGAIIVQIVILIPLVRALQAHFSGPKKPEADRRPSPAPVAKAPLTKNPAGVSPRYAETVAPARFAETVAPKVFAETIAPVGASTPMPVSSPIPVPSPPPPAPSPTAPGETRIGPYLITGILGSGGMATVYLARQASIGRDVALKVITGPDANDPEFGERFRREAETLARLSHPHILKVFDFGEDAGRPYLAMEHMQGGTLREHIGATPIPVPQVLKWADQIGQALGSAHAQGVVHRDIKPENVLLDRNNNAFLSDFGLAHLNDARSNLTRAGVQMGSPSYMPPEQWEGADVDARADLYSFAAMLFELLSGKPPFRAATLPALMTQHVKAPIPSISALRSGLPPSLDRYFARALAKTPAERFPDAASMLAAFRQALRGSFSAGPQRPKPVEPLTATPAPGRPRGHFKHVALAAVALGALVIGQFLSQLKSIGIRPSEPFEPTRTVAHTGPSVTPSPLAATTLNGTLHLMSFSVDRVAFSRALNRIVATVPSSSSLALVDPATGKVDIIPLPNTPWNGLSLSPDGIRALVGLMDDRVVVVHLQSKSVEHHIAPPERGSRALIGDWLYASGMPGPVTTVRGLNLRSGATTVAEGDLRPETSIGLRAHPSGSRLYAAMSGDPRGFARFDATSGSTLPVRFPAGGYIYPGAFWYSERGDFLVTAHGRIVTLNDDPDLDMVAPDTIPRFRTVLNLQIVSAAHFEAMGRLLCVEKIVGPGPSDTTDTITTYKYPGLQPVSRDVLPRLGDADRPVLANAVAVFASPDGRSAYVFLVAPPDVTQEPSAIFVMPIR